jgi:hypothetical protein
MLEPDLSVPSIDARVMQPRPARRQPAASTSSRPAHEQIAERAFLLFLERGGLDGHALEDWLRAEQELSAGAR